MRYQSIDDLPNGVQLRIRRLPIDDPAEWVRGAVPALGGRSVLEIMNEPDGYSKVLKYLTKIEGFLL